MDESTTLTHLAVEHNVSPGETGQRPHNRRVDMASFFSLLSQLSTEVPPGSGQEAHRNPHAEATPVDTANLLRLLQDQFATLLQTSSSETNRDFLVDLIDQIDADINYLPVIHGVSQEFIDGLDRITKKTLAVHMGDVKCPICAERFVDDPHPLVVELPCHKNHVFDLECIAPWLRSKGTCPICRKDFVKKKEPLKVGDSSEHEDEFDSMYA